MNNFSIRITQITHYPGLSEEAKKNEKPIFNVITENQK